LAGVSNITLTTFTRHIGESDIEMFCNLFLNVVDGNLLASLLLHIKCKVSNGRMRPLSNERYTYAAA